MALVKRTMNWSREMENCKIFHAKFRFELGTCEVMDLFSPLLHCAEFKPETLLHSQLFPIFFRHSDGVCSFPIHEFLVKRIVLSSCVITTERECPQKTKRSTSYLIFIPCRNENKLSTVKSWIIIIDRFQVQGEHILTCSVAQWFISRSFTPAACILLSSIQFCLAILE